MTYYYALTARPLPAALHGADGEHFIRPLTKDERVEIEDHLFSKDLRVALKAGTTAVIVPQNQTSNATLEDFAVLVEFALAILSVSGFEPITMVATMNASTCGEVLLCVNQGLADTARFPKKLVNAAACTWVRHLFAARRKAKDKLYITADRFVRYSKVSNSSEALVDLCICLESLIQSQTEISFRFGTCLAKVTRQRNAEELSEMLSDLYDFRSRVVHGTDSSREHAKISRNATNLRLTARTILTTYILYLTEHTKEEWQKHLRSSLFV